MEGCISVGSRDWGIGVTFNISHYNICVECLPKVLEFFIRQF